jgi:hypothetical protein
MNRFSSNRELYEYLVSFSLELKRRGILGLSDAVDFAIAQASSSSTEFLGETRIALRRILSEENGSLTAQERSDVLDALAQLDEAFGK